MKVILTLTTVPTRLVSIHQYDIRYCIDSLLEQDYKDEYEIHFNIPNNYKRTGEPYIIPDWLSERVNNNKKLKIFRTEDYGSVTKLLPTVQRVTDPETLILVVDDDHVYDKETISQHVKNRGKWPQYAIGYDGQRSRNPINNKHASFFGNPKDYWVTATGRNHYVDILQHYKTVSYMRSFFEEDFETFLKDHGTWCDDKTISAYMSLKKIPRVVTYHLREAGHKYMSHEEWMENTDCTFPISKHTGHETKEGVWFARNEAPEEEKINLLYTEFIDKGYDDIELQEIN